MLGKVKWFDPERGFGFIYSEEMGGDLFVHTAGVIPNGDGLKVLHATDMVEFDFKKERQGLKAIGVKVLTKGQEKTNGHQSE
jgi:CspA family cold shock protein